MGTFYFIVAEYFGYTSTHSVVTNAIKAEMTRVAKLYTELPQSEKATQSRADGKRQQANTEQLAQLRTTLELTNKAERKAGQQQKDYAYRLADELIHTFGTMWAMYIATLVTNRKVRTQISDAILWITTK